MNLKSSKSWLIITAVLVVLLCSIASYVNTALPAYIDSPSPSSSEDTKPELPEMSQYLADGVTFEYPAAWTQAQKGANPMFLDSDGTYLLLQKSAYRPQINAVTEASVSNELAVSNFILLYYEKLSSSSFLLSYCSDSIITWEFVIWDREQEYRLIFSTGKERTDALEELIFHIFDSFQWEQTLPIPENMYLVYNSFGNFEFAVPTEWASGTSSEAFSAAHMETGATYSVTVSETPLTTLQNISQLQYVQEAAKSRSNLYIKSYGAAASQVTAESIYTLDGVQMVFYHVMSLHNGYLYEFMLDAPVSSGGADYQIVMECLKYFRTFD